MELIKGLVLNLPMLFLHQRQEHELTWCNVRIMPCALRATPVARYKVALAMGAARLLMASAVLLALTAVKLASSVKRMGCVLPQLIIMGDI